MPGHDGYELIVRLRKLPGGKSVPAVALTALARSEDRTRALRAGFQLHVAKPVDFTELIAVVQNLAALRPE
jgi:CheY-like chemotaxis protein